MPNDGFRNSEAAMEHVSEYEIGDCCWYIDISSKAMRKRPAGDTALHPEQAHRCPK